MSSKRDTMYRTHANALNRHLKAAAETAPFSYNTTPQLPYSKPYRKDITATPRKKRQTNPKKSQRNIVSSGSAQQYNLPVVKTPQGYCNQNSAHTTAHYKPRTCTRLSCFGWRKSRPPASYGYSRNKVHSRLAASASPPTRPETSQVPQSKSSATVARPNHVAELENIKKVHLGSEQKIDRYTFIIESIDDGVLESVQANSRTSGSRAREQQAGHRTLTTLHESTTQKRQDGSTHPNTCISDVSSKIASTPSPNSIPSSGRLGRRGLPLGAIPNPSPRQKYRAGLLTHVDIVQDRSHGRAGGKPRDGYAVDSHNSLPSSHLRPKHNPAGLYLQLDYKNQSKYSMGSQEKSTNYTWGTGYPNTSDQNSETTDHPAQLDSPTLGQELSSQLRISKFPPGETASRVTLPVIHPLSHHNLADNRMIDKFAALPRAHSSNTTIDKFSRPTSASYSTGLDPFYFDEEEQDKAIDSSIWNNWSSTNLFPVTGRADKAPTYSHAEHVKLHPGPNGDGCVTFDSRGSTQTGHTKLAARQESQKATMTYSYLNGVSPDRVSRSWIDSPTDTEDSSSEFPPTPEIGSLMSCRLSGPISSIYSLYMDR